MKRPLAAITMLTVVPCTLAQNFNIDFGGALQDTPPNTYGAAMNWPGYWNAISPAFPGEVQLRDRAGALTNVTIETIGSANTTNWCVGGIVNINWAALMCDQASDSSVVAYNIDNLTPGLYQICIYATHPSVHREFNVRVSTTFGGDALHEIEGITTSSTFEYGVTHALVPLQLIPRPFGDELSSLYIEVTGNGEAAICGMQITRMQELSCPGDLNGDNACDLDDLQLLLFYFGTTCP